MADEILIFDAAGSNVDGTDPGSPLSIGAGTSYPIVEASFPAPPLNVLYTSSIDTEGESPVTRRHGNRTIDLRLGVDESGAVTTLADALAGKFAKLQREGGTLKRTRKDGSVRIYDILAGDGWQVPYDQQYILAHSADIPFTLPAAPYARGAEVDLGDNVETTLPALVFTETGVTGDVPGLGRLLIDEDQAVDQWWVGWGLESNAKYTHTTSTGSGALFYEAETRTAMGGSATAAGLSSPSGTVMSNTTVSTSYTAILSTQATGAGAHLTHVGTFRVWARVMGVGVGSGISTVALEWAAGDLVRYTRNPAWTQTSQNWGKWVLVDLGLVTIPAVRKGTQRWEGRIVAKSTGTADRIDVDWIMFQPVDIGSGEVSGVERVYTPTGYVARDEFSTAGALNAKVMPVAGPWATVGGSATDFQVNAFGTLTRIATADASYTAGRWALASATNYTNISASVDRFVGGVSGSANAIDGVLLRYVNTTNWAVAGRYAQSSFTELWGWLGMIKCVGGTITFAGAPGYGIGEAVLPGLKGGDATVTFSGAISSTGRWSVGLNGAVQASGWDADFQTGGTLATGRVGLYDAATSAGYPGRGFDNFTAYVPIADAAVFASRSVEVRHNGVIRQDSTGSYWNPSSNYNGDYLLIPPAGAEARSVRVIVKGSRNLPGVDPDNATDDLSARLFVTPRFL